MLLCRKDLLDNALCEFIPLRRIIQRQVEKSFNHSLKFLWSIEGLLLMRCFCINKSWGSIKFLARYVKQRIPRLALLNNIVLIHSFYSAVILRCELCIQFEHFNEHNVRQWLNKNTSCSWMNTSGLRILIRGRRYNCLVLLLYYFLSYLYLIHTSC